MSDTPEKLPDLTEHELPHHPWVLAGAVMIAPFMEVLDTTITNVALPHIAGNLSASADESTWVLTSYLVSNAIVLPLGGWFSSLFGRKQFYFVLATKFFDFGIIKLLSFIALIFFWFTQFFQDFFESCQNLFR